LNENKFNPRILYPEKLFKIDGSMKVFHDKQTKTMYNQQATTTKDSSRTSANRKLKKHNHERIGSTKPQEKKRQGIRE
jgi:hypothetical protein